MKREILRIEPKSALKIGFFMGLLGGFIFGMFEAYLIQALAGSKILPAEASQIGELGTASIIMLAVMMALISSLLGSFVGAIVAVFYNYVTRLFGGLEITLTDDPVKPQTNYSQFDSSDDNFNE